VPLSNPPIWLRPGPAILLAWTRRARLVATGSPFDPVQVGGRFAPDRSVQQRFSVPRTGFRPAWRWAPARLSEAMVVGRP